AHLICQSFNDVFSKYGDKTPLFDNMHITAAFATSEPTSIEKVTRRAGKALELRDSYSDPRTIFGRAHRSTSQSEQQRYILSSSERCAARSANAEARGALVEDEKAA